MDDALKTIISGVIAYVLPRALADIGKAFSPSQEKKSLPWVFWVVASFIGGVLGGAFSGAMGEHGFGNWAVYGATLGIMQWLALRGYLPIGKWWAVASTIGWGFSSLFVGNPFGGFLVGLMVGILQMVGSKVEGKIWWIGGNALAWGLVALIGAFFATLGIPFLWANAHQLGTKKLVLPATLIFAFYPEAILMASSQMREPFLISLVVMALWGF